MMLIAFVVDALGLLLLVSWFLLTTTTTPPQFPRESSELAETVFPPNMFLLLNTYCVEMNTFQL